MTRVTAREILNHPWSRKVHPRKKKPRTIVTYLHSNEDLSPNDDEGTFPSASITSLIPCETTMTPYLKMLYHTQLEAEISNRGIIDDLVADTFMPEPSPLKLEPVQSAERSENSFEKESQTSTPTQTTVNVQSSPKSITSGKAEKKKGKILNWFQNVLHPSSPKNARPQSASNKH